MVWPCGRYTVSTGVVFVTLSPTWRFLSPLAYAPLYDPMGLQSTFRCCWCVLEPNRVLYLLPYGEYSFSFYRLAKLAGGVNFLLLNWSGNRKYYFSHIVYTLLIRTSCYFTIHSCYHMLFILINSTVSPLALFFGWE